MKQVAYVLIASTLVIGLQTQSSQAVDAPKDNKGYTTGKRQWWTLVQNLLAWTDGS